MICVAITESDIFGMIKAANSADSDCVELRLDYLTAFNDLDFNDSDHSNDLNDLANAKTIISTCMPGWENGKFEGSETDRIDVLLSSMDFSDYISIELRTEKKLRDKLISECRKKSVKVIVSYHDFNSTPDIPWILRILHEEENAGADIAKIAFMPGNYEDVLNVMNVLVRNDLEIPIIAMSMGELGKTSRIMGAILGSYVTFASAGKGKESAAGQLTVSEMRTVLGILGHPGTGQDTL